MLRLDWIWLGGAALLFGLSCQESGKLTTRTRTDAAAGIPGVDGRLHVGDSEDPVPIDIDFLGQWQFEPKEQPFPPEVLAVSGKTVVIRGFMMPDVEYLGMRQFHLVRSLWGCCFGAPPRINEIVRVEVPEGMDYTFNTLEITGIFHTEYTITNGLVQDLYKIEAQEIRELGYEDPQAPEDFDPSTVDWNNLDPQKRPPLMPKNLPERLFSGKLQAPDPQERK